MQELKLYLPASFADVLEVEQDEVGGADAVVASDLPRLVGGGISVAFVLHRTVLVLLWAASSQDELKHSKEKGVAYIDKALNGLRYVLGQLRARYRLRRRPEIAGGDLSRPRRITRPLTHTYASVVGYWVEIGSKSHIDPDRDGGPAVAKHRFLASSEVRDSPLHDVGDGEALYDIAVLVVLEVDGGLELDLLDIALAVAQGVRLITFLRNDRSACRGVADDRARARAWSGQRTSPMGNATSERAGV